jgi:hypothetical protein
MKPQSVTLTGSISNLQTELVADESCQSSAVLELTEMATAKEVPTYFTVAQFSEVEPVFTQAALRNLIFKAETRKSTKGDISGNGMLESGALVRVGRKVLINRARFLAWIEQQSSKERAS